MEKTNEPNIERANVPQEEKGEIRINKNKLFLFIAVLIIFILTGIVFYMYWDNYVEKGDQASGDKQGEQQVQNQENPVADGNSDDGWFDLFSDKYLSSVSPSSSPSSSSSNGSNHNSSSNQNSNSSNQGNNVTVEDYSGWKTYINSDIGYMLKYPADWKVEEASYYHEVLEGIVKNISISTPDGKYFITFGVKELADSFSISGRTGIGAGDSVKDGKINILDTEVDVLKFMSGGKVIEYFFNSLGSFKTKDGKHECNISFSSDSDVVSGNLNMAGMPEVETAKKILKTVEFIPRSGKICQSKLTAEDKSIMDGWGAYYNKKYKYLIRIPSELTKVNIIMDEKVSPDDLITFLNEKDPNERLQWRSEGEIAGSIPATWTEFYDENTNVACSDVAGMKYYKRGDKIFLMTFFKKDEKRHMILYGFQSVGASMSSDIIDMYKTMIRSIEFGE